jgi:hypothetical protein
MSNNLDSNVTRKVARVFLEKFEASRVVTKTVNTQLLEGKFNPSSGSNVDFKRPHDYNTIRTAGGDISSSTKSDIIAGKATGTVQNYFTVATEWGNVEEALELDQLDQILAPMATRIVTDLEVDFAKYMFKNCNLSYGTPGTVVDAWSDVAGAGALMNSIGVPMDDCYYVMNPFTQQNLASVQQGLNSGSNSLVDTAFQRAQISSNFGGLKAMSSNALGSYTSGTASDRAGTLAANPTVTYVAAKDTMTQVLSCAGFTGNATFKAGEIIQVTGRYRCSLSTRQPVYDATGAQILWRAVITEDATSNTAGAVSLTVAGPAIFEAAGQYNTTTAALASGDVITVLGAASTNYQPNLFYHRQAFGMGSVKLPKLYSTDTVATTEDGFSIRVSKYADGDANTQKVRFDLLPAYATFQPFFAGQGHGV